MACKVPYFVSDSIMVPPEGGVQRRFGKWNDGEPGYERVCLTRAEFNALVRIVCARDGDVAWSSSKHHAELARVKLIRKSTDLHRGGRRTCYSATSRITGRQLVKRALERFVDNHPKWVPDRVAIKVHR